MVTNYFIIPTLCMLNFVRVLIETTFNFKCSLYYHLRIGAIPETVDEWKFLLCLVKNHCSSVLHPPLQNGSSISNGTPNWSNCVTIENVALLLAKVIGPDRALLLLQEYDLMDELSERFAKVCEILRIAERRQRYVL